MAASYGILDMMVYGRQEPWEESPAGWPRPFDASAGQQLRHDGRPTAQWSRIAAGHDDHLGNGDPASDHSHSCH